MAPQNQIQISTGSILKKITPVKQQNLLIRSRITVHEEEKKENFENFKSPVYKLVIKGF